MNVLLLSQNIEYRCAMSNIFAESRKAQNNNVKVQIVVLCLQYMVFTFLSPKIYNFELFVYIRRVYW
jgi:hypothetical protein